ncbi:MAG: hypothetical protein HQK55_09340 [Deltaproteobacteria bacterium]|nr:hypothetical protein [Deltaproteobacteria bacterium]
MASTPPQKPGNKPGDSGDEALLQDLKLSDIEEVGGTVAQTGRPLPKKVELDIDDMLLEEEPPAQIKPEPKKPEPVKELTPLPAEEASEDEEPKARISKKKIAIISALLIIPLALAILFFLPGKPKPTPVHTKKVATGPVDVVLQPFVINFPGQSSGKEPLMYIKFSIFFTTVEGKHEFDAQTVMFRDLIFRFIQGRGPIPFGNSPVRTEMIQSLIVLINEHMKHGQADQLQILEMGLV